MSAVLRCQLQSDAFRAWLQISNRKKEVVAETLALTTLPSEFNYVLRLGTLRWTSNERVVLSAKDGSETIAMCLSGSEWTPDISVGRVQ